MPVTTGLQLGPRELETLRALAAGKTTAEIAADMGVTKITVRHYVRNVLAKLPAPTRPDAVRIGRARGYITDSCPTCGHGGSR